MRKAAENEQGKAWRVTGKNGRPQMPKLTPDELNRRYGHLYNNGITGYWYASGYPCLICGFTSSNCFGLEIGEYDGGYVCRDYAACQRRRAKRDE